MHTLMTRSERSATLALVPALLLGLCSLLELGCSASSDEVSPTPLNLDECLSPCQALTTAGGHYFLEVRPSPAPPQAGDGTLMISVMLDGDVPVTGATLTVEGAMDMGGGMSHGFPEAAVITEAGDGLYSAAVVYSMSGEWKITLGVDKDGTSDSAELSLMVE